MDTVGYTSKSEGEYAAISINTAKRGQVWADVNRIPFAYIYMLKHTMEGNPQNVCLCHLISVGVSQADFGTFIDN